MQRSRKRRPGQILRWAYPVAKYAAVLLIPLSLYRLPRQTWLLPGVTGPRAAMMLWTALLMALGVWADARARRAQVQDAAEQKSGAPVQGSRHLTFLALCDLGLLLLDAVSIAHLYYSWYRSTADQSTQSPPVHLLILMATGCVLWIYGCCLPDIPFGSIWGLRNRLTMSAPTAWAAFHRKCAPYAMIAGALLLAIGTALA